MGGVKRPEHLQGKIGVTLSLRWRKLNHLQADKIKEINYLYDCGMTNANYCYIISYYGC